MHTPSYTNFCNSFFIILSADISATEMLKLCRVTKAKMFFLVLEYVFNFDLFDFSAA